MNARILVVTMSVVLASGCAHTTPEVESFQEESSSVNLTGVGYGTESSYEGHTDGQRRIMAIRAAKVDAIRTLAEQAYGVRVSGQTTVQAAMVQNDSARVYVDAFIRGARFVQVTSMAQGNYEATAELTLDQHFFKCLRSPSRSGCGSQKPPAVFPGYVSAGS